MITRKLTAWSFSFVLTTFLLTTYSLGQMADKKEARPTQKTSEADRASDFGSHGAADNVVVAPTQLNVNKPILFSYFLTIRPFCQDLTKEITQYKTAFKDIQILLVSGHRRVDIAKYAAQLRLEKYSITVLKDDEKLMHTYCYDAAISTLCLTDKNRKLIHRQAESLSV